MIVVAGANGITAWQVQTRFGKSRLLICLNDGFNVEFPTFQPKNPRGLLAVIKDHSELLNGRTLAIGEVLSLT